MPRGAHRACRRDDTARTHSPLAKPLPSRHDAPMDDAEFDRALIAAAFRLAAEKGWRAVSAAASAQAAALPLPRARERFPGRAAILLRFGRRADQAALVEVAPDGSTRDRLFDLLMRRIDTFQAHRAGVLALFHALPTEPPTALLLALATRRSMRWMLEAAGIPTRGVRGELRVNGLVATWLWTMRAWRTDETEDLSATMAALDVALRRAERTAEWLGWSGRTAAPSPDGTEPDPGPAEPPPPPPPDASS